MTDIALDWLSTVIMVELIILLPQEEDPWANFQHNLVIIIVMARQQIHMGLQIEADIIWKQFAVVLLLFDCCSAG